MPKKSKSAKMEEKIEAKAESWAEKCGSKNSSGGSAMYFVGFVGAFVYFMQAADSFGTVVTGVLKAIVWPAMVVYKLLESFYGVV